MTVKLSPLGGAGWQFFDNNGIPLTGGKLYTYVAGSTTPLTTYTTSAGNVSNSNPIDLDSNGRVPYEIWLTEGTSCKFELRTSLDVVIKTWDNITSINDLSSLAGSSGSNSVGFIQSGTGTVARTVQSKLREFVSVLDFGASTDNTATDNATAFNAAITECLSSGRGLIIPSGTYLLPAGTTVNFIGNELHIVGEGRPTLQYTGSGIGFYCSPATDGPYYENMLIQNLLIVGGPGVTTGFYTSGVVRSVIRDIEVRECNSRAFTIRGGVSNTYENLKYSASGHTTTAASAGLYVTNTGVGNFTADCTFINPIMEDFAASGCFVDDASGCTFRGGTFEGCTNGLVIGSTSRLNTFENIWCELNSIKDLEVAGTTNLFVDCNFSHIGSSGNVIVSSGKGNTFIGGYIVKADLQVSSSDTRFIGCGLDQSLGITGLGTYSRIGCLKIDNSGLVIGNYNDNFGPVGSVRFAATQEPSTGANDLDDYEEGTWSASFVPTTSGTVTLNASFNTGSYTKVGRLVTVTGIFYVDSVSSPLGDLKITGLPFAADSSTNTSRAAVAVFATGLDSGFSQPVQGKINTNESFMTLYGLSAGVTTNLAPKLQANSQIYISLTYIA